MNKITFCVLLITLLFVTQVFSAKQTIEKWTDEQGKHHYGQRPVGSKIKKQLSSAINNKLGLKDEVKKEKKTQAPKVYKKKLTRHKNPKDYSRNAF